MPRTPRPMAAARLLLLLLGVKLFAVQSATIVVAPGGSIQDALDVVDAGDTIEIEAGIYFEDLKTRVDGTEDDRITVKGASGASTSDVILRGAGGSTRVFEVKHDYYTIQEFTINGQAVDDPEDENDFTKAYRDKLLYATPDRVPTQRSGGYWSALDGLIVSNMAITTAGGECIRLRYFVTNAIIQNNTITDCGLYDYVFDDGGKNGEGVYVGTSSEQWGDGKNPSDDPDRCFNNIIRHNIIRTKGNEGVDVKEGSIGTVIEYNKIYMQLDVDSGGIDSRADNTIIRYNHIEDTLGAGVRLGGHNVDGYQYGVNNEVRGNTMVDCRAFGVKVMESPQGRICGNDIRLPDGKSEDTYEYSGGDYGDDYKPRDACEDLPAPTPTPTPESTPTSYVGCFADTKNERIMTFESKSNDMTAEVCGGLCNSFPYFGTQYFNECWCGGEDYDQHGESSSCTTACSGDSSESCGGGYAMSVYKNDDVTPPAPTPTPVEAPEDGYVGCYIDKGSDRIMGNKQSTSSMTAEACSALCSASSFYGTQYGVECWCGDDDYDKHGESTSCTMACSGDSSETCGGRNSMSVYKNEDRTPTPTPVSSSSEYVGCYADTRSDRIMTDKQATSDMTAEVCSVLCSSSTYFGTQYSKECWCGDDEFNKHGESSSCTMPCVGDSSETCGGIFAMDVYMQDGSSAGTDPSLLGCFKDTKEGRIMEYQGKSSQMTLTVCANACPGSTYFGTQNSNECWCGDASTDYDQHGDTTCGYGCTGDSSEVCGGRYAMSVYEL